MAELTAKQGKDIILLYRLLSKATKEAAWKLAFQTEHSNEKTRDYNTIATKDGTIGSLAAIEYSLSATSIAANGDPHRAYLTGFSYEPNSEDALELSMEFGVFGKPQKGNATLTEEQANVVQYVFKDTVAG